MTKTYIYGIIKSESEVKRMEDKAAAARRAYNQAYYRRNRERMRQQQKEYWTRRAEKLESAGKEGENNGNR